MKMLPRSTLSIAVATSLLASGSLYSISPAKAIEQIIESKTRLLAGQPYTFAKIIDAKGEVHSQITDGSNKVVSEKEVPPGIAPLVEPRLLNALVKLEQAKLTNQTLQVEIALNLPIEPSDEVLETGSGQVEKGAWVKGLLNGKEISEIEMNTYADQHAKKQQAVRAKEAALRAQNLKDWALRYSLTNQKGLEDALQQGRSGMTAELTTKQLRALIDSHDPLLVGLELYEPGQDDISDAMDATSISTSALPNTTTRGNGIGIYMTEGGCANESRITNYDRLSGSETSHSRNVGAILRAVSPESFIYCRGGSVLPQNSDLDGVGSYPPIHIITRSSSNNDTTSYSTLDRDWDNFSYDNHIVMFNSGGNTGEGTGNVRSPGKGLNVISVANYNDSNDTIVSSSPFVDPETGNEKPEISSPGASVTAGGITMTGTSQATPHAAAFAADMMSHSSYLQYRPQLVKAKMLAGATDLISGGYNKVGLGGIDFASAQWNGHWFWWSGGTNAFNTFDGRDGQTDGYVVKKVFISSSYDKIRVVLSWLTRGSYTYDHRADAHPIGLDLDLSVYDPNGNHVGSSASWDNSFEDVTFKPTISGNYTFKIRRFATRDSNLKLRMGMYVNYYNQ